MHETLAQIGTSLESLKLRIEEEIDFDESFGIQTKQWSAPGIDKYEIIESIGEIIKDIITYGSDEIKDGTIEELLRDYVNRISFLQESLVPQFKNNYYQATATLTLTLDALKRALVQAFKSDPAREITQAIRSLQEKIRSREAQIDNIGLTADELEKMVGRIENAYTSADKLPTDLAALEEARKTIDILAKNSATDRATIASLLSDVVSQSTQIKEIKAEASSVLNRCDEAYRTATSMGLAGAFQKRSVSLGKTVAIWVAGLVISLAIGGWLGHGRIKEISDLLKSEASPAIVFTNIIASVLAVGAPIWFAWLSTKQIGQRFRLAEDYAFKASVSQAYEGFRREAARHDGDMEARLLSSALMRIDEQPLRLVETGSHGSPMHELLNSPLIKRAVVAVPGYLDEVLNLADQRLQALKPSTIRSTPERKVQAVHDEPEADHLE